MRYASTLAIAALLVGTGAPALAEDRALVIGINDYAELTGALSLTGAVADADRMADLLTEEMGFAPGAVTVLRDAEARHDVILSEIIDGLISGTEPGDRVLLYFAGLGTILSDGGPALLAHDGASVVGQIPLETLEAMFAHIGDRQISVVLDAGFAPGAPGSRGQGHEIGGLGPDVTLWSAAEPGQSVWESANGGAFTRAWASAARDGASDADGDNAITEAELSGPLTTALATSCDALPACADGAGQTPSVTGPAAAVLVRLATPEPAPEPVLTPIEEDDGLPASYLETLGFVSDLFSPSNAAGLTLSITGSITGSTSGDDTLRIGDTVNFSASADRDGALLLLDLDPSGALAQVYPSTLSPEGATRIVAGEVLTIPSALGASGQPLRLRVTEPAGPGLLLGLFIEGDLEALSALMPAGLEGGPVPGGNQSLFQISQDLLRLEADPDRPIAWSAAYLPYRIEP
ncbi:MAG: caspase family protein [Pseudomonadota bacterium]